MKTVRIDQMQGKWRVVPVRGHIFVHRHACALHCLRPPFMAATVNAALLHHAAMSAGGRRFCLRLCLCR